MFSFCSDSPAERSRHAIGWMLKWAGTWECWCRTCCSHLDRGGQSGSCVSKDIECVCREVVCSYFEVQIAPTFFFFLFKWYVFIIVSYDTVHLFFYNHNLIDAADITYFLWGIGLIVGHIDVALWFLWSKSMWTNAVVETNPIMEEAIIHVHPTSRETAGERVMHTCKAESGRVRRRGCQTGRSLTNNCWGGIHFIPLLTVNDL